VRVYLADDSVLFREGLARLLQETGFDVVGQAGEAEDLLKGVRRLRPQVAVVDIRMPPSYTDEGLVAAHRIRMEDADVGILLLSQYVETAYAMTLMENGAKGLGYLLKDRVSNLQELTDALRRVGSGGTAVDPEVVSRLLERKRHTSAVDDLTDREGAVLALMAEGRSNQAIADRLHMSGKTVEAHVRSIFVKFNLMPAVEDHRRVLAVLSYLRSSARSAEPSVSPDR
jgi:DNA-binding NarL/FixJ family response regulator